LCANSGKASMQKAGRKPQNLSCLIFSSSSVEFVNPNNPAVPWIRQGPKSQKDPHPIASTSLRFFFRLVFFRMASGRFPRATSSAFSDLFWFLGGRNGTGKSLPFDPTGDKTPHVAR